MDSPLTIDDVATQLGTVTSNSDARAVTSRASRVAGVPHHRPLDLAPPPRVCEALAAQRGTPPHMAVLIARRGGASGASERPSRGMGCVSRSAFMRGPR